MPDPGGSDPATAHRLWTEFARAGERHFLGFVVDQSDRERKFAVEILVDGYPLKVLLAQDYVHELAAAQVGDGCYGFSFSLDQNVLADGAVVEARLANIGNVVGQPIALECALPPLRDSSAVGAVRWLGSLRFSGWVANLEEAGELNVFVDGVLITRARASGWSHVGDGQDARAVRAFDVHLPERFADAKAHQLEVVNWLGESLAGSPVAFLAIPGVPYEGAAHAGCQTARQYLPGSWPLSRYQEWRERLPVNPGPGEARQVAVVMIGSEGMDVSQASLHEQSHPDWVVPFFSSGAELATFDPGPVLSFLEGTDCAYVVFALSGTLFSPTAMHRIVGAFAAFEGARAIYGDFDIRGKDGSVWPMALPAFDYERMLELGYCAHLFALHSADAIRSLSSGASNLYRLFNSILDDRNSSNHDIIHLPGALAIFPSFDAAAARPALAAASLACLERRGIEATATPNVAGVFPAVRISRNVASRSATVIVPTRNRRDLLEDCIESIRPACKRERVEIAVVDNDSSDTATLAYLAQIDNRIAKVLRVPGPFNRARLVNSAVRVTNGDLLCLVDPHVRALDDLWLQEMMGRIGETDVGAVGALLVRTSGVVQHGGVVLGPGFAATPAFSDRVDGDFGYADLLVAAHECSAVTAACLMTRRSDYLEVRGMDEVRFPANFHDVDYCLKLRALGRRIVFTPHAKLVHDEPARSEIQAPLFEREVQNLRTKWSSVLVADPFYSPMLSLDPYPFSALGWPPREMGPRDSRSPPALGVPHGF
ncbi:glycosyltransferase [Mesorhizobium sp. VK9D]|uniref:glycosyltransferase family 2 protein n=1 Tax=Mesorhizobium australafricanum TaxID=3072311 RepID=UPI002A245296|nr:glycosyltransferase [Mesorhizobium sp. VK9D]MDX8456000.1 glycosyltransferase [Mesorhizobium sp. VK9D]